MNSYEEVNCRDISLFKEVSEADWNDWRWQLKHAISDIGTLSKIIHIDDAEKADLERVLKRFKMAITPYYAAVMDRAYKLCSVRLQAVPSARELDEVKECLVDPLHEEVDSEVPGITHRYPDRVLFLVTNVCAMYCRHCTRRRVVGHDDHHLVVSGTHGVHGDQITVRGFDIRIEQVDQQQLVSDQLFRLHGRDHRSFNTGKFHDDVPSIW